MSDTFDQMATILARGSDKRYGIEAVSQLEHALQCATNAERDEASPALVTAALVHDIGHLLTSDLVPAALRGEDAHHEERGASFLSQWFGDDVRQPVRLHVAAKRYLTAWEPDYYHLLSEGSRRTLALQGGPFNPQEAAEFLRTPGAEEALMVRRWDEQAKVGGAETPPLEHFRTQVEVLLQTSAA